MRQHITPTWRTVPLAKITFGGLTHWVSQLSLGGLGPSGIRQSVFVMSAALDHAVRSGRIRSNPARGLGLPRPKRRDYVFLTHGQVLTLADEAGRWRLLILVLAYTGLRWGEATALRVCDIDFDRRRVDVRRAFSDVGGRVVLGTPKSHQSRTVPLPRFVAVELAGAVDGKRPDDLVFTMPGGSVMRLSNWRRATFVPARTRAGLSDRFRIHDLRHTAASLMIQAGYPPKMLQEIMGHASITTTLDLYGHLYPGEMDRYADRLDEAASEADDGQKRPDDDDDEQDDGGLACLTWGNSGALGGTRTPNLLIRSQMLYPLSYERWLEQYTVAGALAARAGGECARAETPSCWGTFAGRPAADCGHGHYRAEQEHRHLVHRRPVHQG